MPVVPAGSASRNRRLYSAQGWGYRLDGGHDRPDDGLEDSIISREVVFSPPAIGNGGTSPLASVFSYGEKDYYLGGHPVWELFRVAYRVTKRPYLVGGLALGLGYFWAFFARTPRPVSR